MLSYLARRVFGSANDRIVKKTRNIIAKINALEPEIQSLDDTSLRNKTAKFKSEIENGRTLDDLLPEAFAVVREAARRVLGMRHFDVQLIGGVILHKGMIAEMKTGEGKTLMATLSVYLNALPGKGVHVVTVNDYLAKRDAEWMGKIYDFLGITVGCITSDVDELTRKQAYEADITYGTNNEFGFDYLRDNLKYNLKSMAQRPFNFAIVDEVDSILIDEARTPLIISGPTENNSELYGKIDKIITKLTKEDFDLDEKSRSAMFTDIGHEKIENVLRKNNLILSNSSVYDVENMMIIHHLNQALKAHKVFAKDVDYIIKDSKIMIIDEFTGRVMEGRRYSDGLHQAIEAKEGVKIQNENQTIASITFQNYFRMYPKLSGMTGTAMTEANEFSDIYKLEVVEIPTNIPLTRIDEDDQIYKTSKEKYDAIISEIEGAYNVGQPVLVGTVSIEKSEYLSGLLKKKKIKHNVLNARYHEQEAEIIAQAGRFKAITIATNMAGRGTDIKLGGNLDMLLKSTKSEGAEVKEKLQKQVINEQQEVLEKGGLLVIGTERHESRRIDNQLRGRSGRQGDAGRTKFFLSLEDDLMRIFGSEKISNMLTKLGLKEGEAITHPWISKSIAKAQQRVEARNYEMRKTLLKFDDVMNEQRRVIYSQRIEIMNSDNLMNSLKSIMESINTKLVSLHISKNSYKEESDLSGIEKDIFRIYGLHLKLKREDADAGEVAILELLNKKVWDNFSAKIQEYGSELMEEVVRRVFLVSLDHLWKDHLYSLDHMRAGINLRAYAQKDPLNEYKMEAFNLFQGMLSELDEVLVQRCSQLHISQEGHNNSSIKEQTKPALTDESSTSSGSALPQTISRNSPCPCGSGKKYKHCHGIIK